MNKKKIFIAISIPDDVKNKLLKYADSEEFAYLPVFWTNKDNLHITLKFLGYADDDEVYETAELLKEIVAGIEPFDIRLEKIAPGPSAEDAKMVWVVGEESENLQKLNRRASEILSDIRYENIDKKFKFRLHITLGRIARSAIEKGEKVNIEEKKLNVIFPVYGIDLMESFKEGGKIRYAILQSAEFHE